MVQCWTCSLTLAPLGLLRSNARVVCLFYIYFSMCVCLCVQSRFIKGATVSTAAHSPLQILQGLGSQSFRPGQRVPEEVALVHFLTLLARGTANRSPASRCPLPPHLKQEVAIGITFCKRAVSVSQHVMLVSFAVGGADHFRKLFPLNESENTADCVLCVPSRAFSPCTYY